VVQARPRPAPERAGPALVVAIVLFAINLRTVLASLPPLVTDIRADLGLSGAAAGLLTTLPVLLLGALAPLAPRIVARVPIERAIVVCAVATAAGAGLRGAGTTAALLAGGLVAGAAIAIGQAIVPVLIRSRYALQAGMLTGAFSMALVLGSTIAAGAAVPLARAFDDSWAASLAFWAVPAAIAATVWLRWGLGPGTVVDRRGSALLRGSALAWAVSAFFGIQSMAFYGSLSWLPTILEDRGWSEEAAGGLLALASLVGLVPAFLIPVFAARGPHQLRPLALVVGLPLAGLLGLLAAPDAAPLWMVLIGLGQSGALGLALMLPLQRGGDRATAAALTAMALCVGYLVAATGPWLLGAVHDWSDGWTLPLVVLIAITALELVPGVPAALARTIRGSKSHPPGSTVRGESG
jgi:CP family cyanate transporter-like MFS transporter